MKGLATHYLRTSVISELYSLLTAWLHSHKSYGYYAPTDYSLVIFRSLHYNRPRFDYSDEKVVVVVHVFLTSTSNIMPVQGRIQPVKLGGHFSNMW